MARSVSERMFSLVEGLDQAEKNRRKELKKAAKPEIDRRDREDRSTNLSASRSSPSGRLRSKLIKQHRTGGTLLGNPAHIRMRVARQLRDAGHERAWRVRHMLRKKKP